MSQEKGKNTIFLATSADELYKWDYQYKNLFYALDFQT